MSRAVYYVAMSADGFIAAPDGGVGWLDPYNAPELGYDDFVAKVGAVVIGRSTYEQMLGFGPWPYGDREGLMVTSRPAGGLPPGVRAVTPSELPVAFAELRRGTTRDVWVVGGGQTARACLEAGLIGAPRRRGDQRRRLRATTCPKISAVNGLGSTSAKP
jgi:dihydrofolate reductase